MYIFRVGGYNDLYTLPRTFLYDYKISVASDNAKDTELAIHGEGIWSASGIYL